MEKEVVEEKKSIKEYIKELIPYVVILVIVVLFRTFIATPVIVKGPSMNPTLDGGELMILFKRPEIKRFDVVVVNNGKEDIIKRVIAMPGETISCEDGKWYVNDRLQEEEYSKQTEYCTPSGKKTFDKIKLKDDEYFVLGDNRMNSADSREYGPFDSKHVKGRSDFILFPFKKFGKVK